MKSVYWRFLCAALILGFLSNCTDLLGPGFDLDEITGDLSAKGTYHFIDVETIPLSEVPLEVWELLDEKGDGALIDTIEAKEIRRKAGISEELEATLIDSLLIDSFKFAITLNSDDSHFSTLDPFLPLTLLLYKSDKDGNKLDADEEPLTIGLDIPVHKGAFPPQSRDSDFQNLEHLPDWEQLYTYIFDISEETNQLSDLFLSNDFVSIRIKGSLDKLPFRNLESHMSFHTTFKAEGIIANNQIGRDMEFKGLFETKTPILFLFEDLTEDLLFFSEDGDEIELIGRGPKHSQHNKDLFEKIKSWVSHCRLNDKQATLGSIKIYNDFELPLNFLQIRSVSLIGYKYLDEISEDKVIRKKPRPCGTEEEPEFCDDPDGQELIIQLIQKPSDYNDELILAPISQDAFLNDLAEFSDSIGLDIKASYRIKNEDGTLIPKRSRRTGLALDIPINVAVSGEARIDFEINCPLEEGGDEDN